MILLFYLSNTRENCPYLDGNRDCNWIQILQYLYHDSKSHYDRTKEDWRRQTNIFIKSQKIIINLFLFLWGQNNHFQKFTKFILVFYVFIQMERNLTSKTFYTLLNFNNWYLSSLSKFAKTVIGIHRTVISIWCKHSCSRTTVKSVATYKPRIHGIDKPNLF